jgi:hypothetical protein
VSAAVTAKAMFLAFCAAHFIPRRPYYAKPIQGSWSADLQSGLTLCVWLVILLPLPWPTCNCYECYVVCYANQQHLHACQPHSRCTKTYQKHARFLDLA